MAARRGKGTDKISTFKREGEKLLRLRQQISDCGFDKYPEEVKTTLVEIFLIDAVIEGCLSQELWRRILQQDRSFSEVEALGVTLEGIENQVKSFGGKIDQADVKQQVLRVKDEPVPSFHKNFQNPIGVKRKFENKSGYSCYNCGRRDHISTSEKCPAKGKVCHACKRVGHFESSCRSRNSNKKIPLTTKQVRDSGSDVNLIPDNVWEQLKQSNVAVYRCVKGSEKVLKGYGNDNPLTILGSFVTDVKVGKKSVRAEFFVIKGGQRSILGDETSKELGILLVGLHINRIASEAESFPKIKDVQVQIHTDPEIKPVFQPIRRIPIPLEAAVDQKLNHLLAKDIIEVKQGPASWVSPLVVVGKSNGEPRVCLDLRRVNKAVLRERHPMPVVDEYLARLGKGKLWSKLDIKDAFLQVELAPESRDITTFITNKGLFCFKRLPFGLVIAPELFQKVMDQILVGCAGTYWYLDDVIVEGRNQKGHDERLEEVLRRLKDRSVELNWEKCVFRVDKVEFLGHTISALGIAPSISKVEAILSFRQPESESEVRSFLGLANYLNKFLPNLATLDEPLRKLTRKDSTFLWTNEQQVSFERIKASMANVQNLGFFNEMDRTAIMTDASPTGLGALLLQTDMSGCSRIVHCASKSLTDTEKKYCQTEKEALAIVWAVERFYTYLYGSEFDILTDCKALEYLFTVRSRPCARIERWVLRIQTFDYEIIYIPGEKNVADVLSRLSTLKSVPFDPSEEITIKQVAIDAATTAALDWKEIVRASRDDAEIRHVLECLDLDKVEELPLAFRIVANELCRCDDVLLRTNRIVIPTVLRERILRVAHEGHIGTRMMKSHLRSAVWWPKMDVSVEEFVKRCRSCTLVAAPEPPTPMVRKEMPYGPWEEIAADFLGPLPNGQTLFVVVDYYSRFIEVCKITQTTARETILQLSRIFTRYGVPLTLRADNAPQLNTVCEEIKVFCEDMGIKLINTIPYWPQQNGKVERQNRSILKRLTNAQELGQDWRRVLDQYILSYHSTPHPTTGRSPFDLMFGRRVRNKLPQIPREVHCDEAVSDFDRTQKEKGRIYADHKRKARRSDIEEGDKVLVKRFRNGADVTLRCLETGKEYRRNVAHLKKLPDLSPATESTNESAPIPRLSLEDGLHQDSENDRQSNIEGHTEDNESYDRRQQVKRSRKEPNKFKDYLPH
ncbi:uncharacterized protein K02A2.6-like [Toxorhynchites rutilus septentrionalis]|uniref:uncharacterized protein K02A2.6-like n=1 Tax=Toxorhynchites rutilus septentrionalis TaxID=329112 RepID=UPI00247924DA|nr:uncharacterized protein K02A2.6-like [Toxorhynchites rutilus septentrionalis]